MSRYSQVDLTHRYTIFFFPPFASVVMDFYMLAWSAWFSELAGRISPCFNFASCINFLDSETFSAHDYSPSYIIIFGG